MGCNGSRSVQRDAESRGGQVTDKRTGFQLLGAAVEAYDRYVTVFMRPFAAVLLERVGLRPGDSVLDVACGTGLVASTAAERVGADGRIAGLDINGGMLQVARSRRVESGPDVEWHEASAMSLPFEDGSFRAVVCQQGLQFMPDSEAALRELVRVTAPGGRVAVSVWSSRERSPYLAAEYSAWSATVPGRSSELEGMWDCNDRLPPTQLYELFTAVGLVDVEVEEVRAHVEMPSLEELARGHKGISGDFSDLTIEDRERYVSALLDLLAGHTRPDGSATLPFSSSVASGAKPR